jgi:hypothetical protein
MSDYDPPSLMRRPDPGWASRPRPGRAGNQCFAVWLRLVMVFAVICPWLSM